MKITAQEEYGLRILIRIAACRTEGGLSIPQLSEAEGLSSHYIAKLARILRMEGFINSTPGYKGGYVLAGPAENISVKKVLKTLGGELYDEDFCKSHPGSLKICCNSVECSARSLWHMIQFSVDQLLDKVTLDDLINSENNSLSILHERLKEGKLSS
jgi:Rrf2 family protein